MKTIYILVTLLFFTVTVGYSQDDVEKYIAEAKDAYNSGKLQDARFALEQTLQAIDVVIGQEILKILPTDLDQFTYDQHRDNVMGNAGGITGLNVSRYYNNKTDSSKTLEITIINNSPMIATLNAFMTNPLFMNSSNGDQKVVRVSGYKAVLNKRKNNDVLSGYELQIPFNQSLITYTCEGVTDENDMITLAGKVDIKGIIKLAGGGN